MVVAHVIDAEDEAKLVVGNSVTDVLKESVLVLPGLLVDLGHVKDLCALRLRHTGGYVIASFSESFEGALSTGNLRRSSKILVVLVVEASESCRKRLIRLSDFQEFFLGAAVVGVGRTGRRQGSSLSGKEVELIPKAHREMFVSGINPGTMAPKSSVGPSSPHNISNIVQIYAPFPSEVAADSINDQICSVRNLRFLLPNRGR